MNNTASAQSGGREAAERIELLTSVSTVATEMAAMPTSEIDLGVLHLFARAGVPEFVDRIVVLQEVAEPGMMTVTHVWNVPSPAQDRLPHIRRISVDHLSWVRTARAGGTTIIDPFSDFSHLTDSDRYFLSIYRITGLVVLPLRLSSTQMGVMITVSTRINTAWPEQALERLRMIATLVEGVLARKLAEEETHSSDLRLTSALKGGGTGVWEWDPSTDTIWFSEQWCAMLGHHPAAMENDINMLRSLIHPDDLARVSALLARHFEDPSVEYNIKYRVRTGDGTWKWILTRGFVTERSPEGAPTRMIGMDVDITPIMQEEDELMRSKAELSAALQELEHAAQMKRDFLTGISHELRTPLTAILGMSELLQMQTDPPMSERQVGYAHTIQESGRRLLSLIDDLIDAAAFESGGVTLDTQQVNVTTVCMSALALMHRPAMRGRVRLEHDLPDREVTIPGDYRRLRQMLLNLLTNAITYTPEEGTVTLRVRPVGSPPELCIEVRDTGVGIAAADIPRLFNPFERAGADPSHQSSSIGLGLAIVKHIAQLHHGFVDVTSTPGSGSCFIVHLPMKAGDD